MTTPPCLNLQLEHACSVTIRLWPETAVFKPVFFLLPPHSQSSEWWLVPETFLSVVRSESTIFLAVFCLRTLAHRSTQKISIIISVSLHSNDCVILVWPASVRALRLRICSAQHFKCIFRPAVFILTFYCDSCGWTLPNPLPPPPTHTHTQQRSSSCHHSSRWVCVTGGARI